jgi:DNA-binding CsgD family transcriptional regulator
MMDKAREADLAHAHIEYDVVFEHLPTAAAVLYDRVIVDCNALFRSLMRGSRGDLVGQSFRILYAAPEDFEVRGKRVAEVLRAASSYADDRLLRRLDGEIFWCHISGYALERRSPFRRAIWTFVDLSIERQTSSSVRSSLTHREREVATQLLEGLSSKEIAKRLNISPRTVDIHRGSLLRKYGVESTADLLVNLVKT